MRKILLRNALWKHLPVALVPTAFLVLPGKLYNLIETQYVHVFKLGDWMIQQFWNLVTTNLTNQFFAWLQQIISESVTEKSMFCSPSSQIFVAHKCPFYSTWKTGKSVTDH